MSRAEFRRSRRKKLNFWGAVASIIGVPLAIFFWVLPPTTASSQSQSHPSVSTTGYQSPAIGSSGRDVIINYSSPVKGTGYELKRSTPLMDSSEAPMRMVCSVPAGTSVSPTGKKANSEMWWQVKVIDGDCTDKVGWVSLESLSVK
jgi:hypothetical protein